MKLTKRKAFNFLRSYFDVLNELKEDSDKLDFLMSIIDKQFLDEDPKDLGFIAKLCYESQRHSIEKSVKGWKTANKTDLLGNPTPPSPLPPTLPKGSPLPLPPKEEQEQEEVQGKEEEKVKKEVIETLYSLYPSKCPINNSNTGKSKNNKDKIKTLLKEHSEDHLKYTINRYKDECLKDKRYMKNFGTFLNNLPDYDKEDKTPVRSKCDELKINFDKVLTAANKTEDELVRFVEFELSNRYKQTNQTFDTLLTQKIQYYDEK